MKLLVPILTVAVCAVVWAAQETRPADELPPGHPPINPLPPGHPPINPLPPGHPPIAPAPGDPADVASPGDVVAAYYESISGPVGAPRDWDRFRSLFLADARLMAVTNSDLPVVLGPDQFIRMNSGYFEAGGYFERSIREQRQEFARVAHAWSTYEARRGGDDEPYSRGVTSFQLLRAQGRWWIANVVWDRERDGVELPPEYLP